MDCKDFQARSSESKAMTPASDKGKPNSEDLKRAEEIAFDPLLPLPGELTRNRLQIIIAQALSEERARIQVQKETKIMELEKIINDAHMVLDQDDSKIIRNAKDGYPEGREPHELTLSERISAICRYAADYKRWFSESKAQTLNSEAVQGLVNAQRKSIAVIQSLWEDGEKPGWIAVEMMTTSIKKFQQFKDGK